MVIRTERSATEAGLQKVIDYSFLIPPTGDRVPAVFIENGDVVNRDATDPIQVDYSKPIGDEATGTQDSAVLK